MPSGVESGEVFGRCIHLAESLSVAILPEECSVPRASDTLTVKVTSGNKSWTRTVAARGIKDVDPDPENGISITAAYTEVVEPESYASEEEYKEAVNGRGLTPGSVQFGDLVVSVDSQGLLPAGGAVSVSIIGETEGRPYASYSTGELFLYKTATPAIGSFSAHATSVPKTRWVSGVEYVDGGTVIHAIAEDITNACFYATPGAVKATIDATSVNGGTVDIYAREGAKSDEVIDINDESAVVGEGVDWQESPSVTITVYGCADPATGEVMTATSTKAIPGEFWSSLGSPTKLKEDFFGESREKNRTADLRRRTLEDGVWDSDESLDVLAGLRVRSGKLEYSGMEGDGPRTWCRRFKGDDSKKHISQFDITVGGLDDSFGEFGIYCKDAAGDTFRINRVDGGIATTTPVGGKWHCVFPAWAEQPTQTDGLFIWVEMDSDTKATITGIELSELN